MDIKFTDSLRFFTPDTLWWFPSLSFLSSSPRKRITPFYGFHRRLVVCTCTHSPHIPAAHKIMSRNDFQGTQKESQPHLAKDYFGKRSIFVQQRAWLSCCNICIHCSPYLSRRLNDGLKFMQLCRELLFVPAFYLRLINGLILLMEIICHKALPLVSFFPFTRAARCLDLQKYYLQLISATTSSFRYLF